MIRYCILILVVMSLIIGGCGDKEKPSENTPTPTIQGTSTYRVKVGDTVKVDYTGTLDDGTQFDTSIGKNPLEFTVGTGAIIPGFDKAVQGMQVSESKIVRISPEDGYGEYKGNFTEDIPIEMFAPGSNPHVGQYVNGIYPIIAVSDTTVTIDKNHRLAGKYLTFEIKLIEIVNTSDNTPTPLIEGPLTYTAIMKTSVGNITLILYRNKVPLTVDNFVRLARDGFYDGMIFHRVKENFMIQAGKETTDGVIKQSPYGMINLETNPDVQHVDGAISMAHSDDPNTASAEFFICDGAQHMLDGKYAAFGVVTEGIEIVREIASTPNDGSFEPDPGGGRPLETITINSIEIQEGT